jgi:hypothetical protein
MYAYKTGIGPIDALKGGLEPGTGILVLAPAQSSGEQLGYALTRPRPGEYAVILSTTMRSVDVRDFLAGTGFNRDFIGIIDSVTKLSTPGIADSMEVKYVASPSDLTGIGIKFSSLMESIFQGEFSSSTQALFPPPVRFYVDSLTTMLMYRKLEVLYQFLHVLNTRLKKMESLGIYILNGQSFDERTISLMRQLMNVVIEVKTGPEGEFLRIHGIPGVTREWMEFTVGQGSVEVKV